LRWHVYQLGIGKVITIYLNRINRIIIYLSIVDYQSFLYLKTDEEVLLWQSNLAQQNRMISIVFQCSEDVPCSP